MSSPGRSSGRRTRAPRSRYISEQGPQGPVGPACQKFSERGSGTIRSSGTPMRAPDLDRLRRRGRGRAPRRRSKTVTQIRSGSKPKPSSESSQPQAIDSLLEVVAEARSCRASRRRSGGARCCRPPRCRACGSSAGTRRAAGAGGSSPPAEVGLERLHPGDRRAGSRCRRAAGTSDAEGRRRCPRSSKKDR